MPLMRYPAAEFVASCRIVAFCGVAFLFYERTSAAIPKILAVFTGKTDHIFKRSIIRSKRQAALSGVLLPSLPAE
jgi:hypothetical protein